MAIKHHCILRKIHHGEVGMPDRELLAPGGIAVQIEFKVPGTGPSKIQSFQQARLRLLGQRVENVRSYAEFRALLADVLTMASGGGSL